MQLGGNHQHHLDSRLIMINHTQTHIQYKSMEWRERQNQKQETRKGSNYTAKWTLDMQTYHLLFPEPETSTFLYTDIAMENPPFWWYYFPGFPGGFPWHLLQCSRLPWGSTALGPWRSRGIITRVLRARERRHCLVEKLLRSGRVCIPYKMEHWLPVYKERAHWPSLHFLYGVL